MANHKSAKKRARQTIVKTERNKAKKSEVRSAIKEIRAAISEKDKEKATELLPKTQSLLSKLTKDNIAKKNNSANKTSRLASQIAKL